MVNSYGSGIGPQTATMEQAGPTTTSGPRLKRSSAKKSRMEQVQDDTAPKTSARIADADGCHLLKLDNRLLEWLFALLPDIVSKLRLAATCHRLHVVSQGSAAWKHDIKLELGESTKDRVWYRLDGRKWIGNMSNVTGALRLGLICPRRLQLELVFEGETLRRIVNSWLIVNGNQPGTRLFAGTKLTVKFEPDVQRQQMNRLVSALTQLQSLPLSELNVVTNQRNLIKHLSEPPAFNGIIGLQLADSVISDAWPKIRVWQQLQSLNLKFRRRCTIASPVLFIIMSQLPNLKELVVEEVAFIDDDAYRYLRGLIDQYVEAYGSNWQRFAEDDRIYLFYNHKKFVAPRLERLTLTVSEFRSRGSEYRISVLDEQYDRNQVVVNEDPLMFVLGRDACPNLNYVHIKANYHLDYVRSYGLKHLLRKFIGARVADSSKCHEFRFYRSLTVGFDSYHYPSALDYIRADREDHFDFAMARPGAPSFVKSFLSTVDEFGLTVYDAEFVDVQVLNHNHDWKTRQALKCYAELVDGDTRFVFTIV